MKTDKFRRVAKEIQLAETGRLGPVFFHGPLMLPFLRDGDLLTVAPVRAEDVRTGDIITYRDAEKFPTLRVIGRSAGGFVLKGDNFPATHLVRPEDILGRVVERHREEEILTRGSPKWVLAAWYILARQRYRDWRLRRR